MAFDALSLSVISKELRNSLIGGKITKIYQPERDEIILFVWNKQSFKLLISANASVNRIHLTDKLTENPQSAPSFCMLLRKHLTNAVITDIYQMPYERVLDFSLNCKNELGYEKTYHLIFELTGKTSNIILTDSEYIIADSIKHLPQDINSSRLIMSGNKYSFFDAQNKLLPFELERIRQLLEQSHTSIKDLLIENLLGVSQDTVKEFVYGTDDNDRSPTNINAVLNNIADYQTRIDSPTPNIVFVNGSPTDVLPFDYKSKHGEKMYYNTLNSAHDNYYYFLDKYQRFRDKAKSITAIVKNAISRTEKKLAIQKQSLLDAQDNIKYKEFGDLILSNIYKIKNQAAYLETENYFDKDYATVRIPLEANLSPQQNAQNYYKKYQKQKSTILHNSKLVKDNTELLNYLQTVKQSLLYCNELSDLSEIQSELISQNIIKEKKTQKKQKELPSKPLLYNVYGFDIWVGKNNTQNDYVTFKLAQSTDIWLHTQFVHSSHTVIVSNGNAIPDNVLSVAAEITAYFSQARQGSKIAVDYTLKCNVKKPRKSPIGFVTYDSYKTIIVNPNEHKQLLKQL
ncbi:MAG: NFACT family protein [Corallococcus sp.]|nr:NFACT family protein [Corallococcus sp.]